MNKNSVMVIGGPTASGKSKLAVDLASALNGEVINADSMQVYKELPILSAIPEETERKAILHHLFAIYDSNVRGNVVDWLELCTAKIKEIWQREKMPIVVGGTGLYLQNLMEGTTPIPPTLPSARRQIAEEFATGGLEKMYQKLQKIDEEKEKLKKYEQMLNDLNETLAKL